MAVQSGRVRVIPQMLEAMRQGELDRAWLAEHPEVLEPYRGQWAVVHKGRVVAHSPDPRAVARDGNTQTHPGALFLYVPTREEAEAALVPLL